MLMKKMGNKSLAGFWRQKMKPHLQENHVHLKRTLMSVSPGAALTHMEVGYQVK